MLVASLQTMLRTKNDKKRLRMQSPPSPSYAAVTVASGPLLDFTAFLQYLEGAWQHRAKYVSLNMDREQLAADSQAF